MKRDGGGNKKIIKMTIYIKQATYIIRVHQ